MGTTSIASLPVRQLSLWEILRQRVSAVRDITTPNEFSEFYSELHRSFEVRRINAQARVVLLQNTVQRIQQEIESVAEQCRELSDCLKGVAASARAKRWLAKEREEILAMLISLLHKQEEMETSLENAQTLTSLAEEDWKIQEHQLYTLDRANSADKLKALTDMCVNSPPDEVVQWPAYAEAAKEVIEKQYLH